MAKKIALTQGMFTLVDDADYAWLSEFSWSLHRDKSGVLYAMRAKMHGPPSMHRTILRPKEGVEVDHVDRDGLNNQRYNLRIATRAGNVCNRRGWSNTGYKGVCKLTNNPKWGARVQIDGRMRWLGSYPTPEEAARAYDVIARELHGEFAVLNFPG